MRSWPAVLGNRSTRSALVPRCVYPLLPGKSPRTTFRHQKPISILTSRIQKRKACLRVCRLTEVLNTGCTEPGTKRYHVDPPCTSVLQPRPTERLNKTSLETFYRAQGQVTKALNAVGRKSPQHSSEGSSTLLDGWTPPRGRRECLHPCTPKLS